jgi:hypothetical protein
MNLMVIIPQLSSWFELHAKDEQECLEIWLGEIYKHENCTIHAKVSGTP